MAKVVVTGGAGFIGSHLVSSLIAQGDSVVVIDDLRTGRVENLAGVKGDSRLQFHCQDVRNTRDIIELLNDATMVYHLAPNGETSTGVDAAAADIDILLESTLSILQAMRQSTCKRLVLSSSSVVYGDQGEHPSVESDGPLLPISTYGAGKVACEAAVSAFSAACGFEATILRFGNVIGGRMARGVIRDFVHKLHADPTLLPIKGDGTQVKPFVHVSDIVNGLLKIPGASCDAVTVVNLASGDSISIREVARHVATAVSVDPVIRGTKESCGWAGDIPRVYLDIGRARSLGWKPLLTSAAAVKRAAVELAAEVE